MVTRSASTMAARLASKPAPSYFRAAKSGPFTSRTIATSRCFSSTKDNKASNRIYTSVRHPSELEEYILLSTSSRRPLITLWSAAYCPSCRTILPLLTRLLSPSSISPAESAAGEAQGGISFCEVEYDAPDIMNSDLGMRYMVRSLPMLMSFDRGEAMLDTRVSDTKLLCDERFLKEWIEKEASRSGGGSGGGKGILGGLFGQR